MGKQTGKWKKGVDKSGETRQTSTKTGENSLRAYDKDTATFIAMAQELKYEGNQLFQTRDIEGAMIMYDKAIKLLPRNHIDVSYLRSNMAACYMQLGISEYPRAIHECNLALEVTPKYSKALLKRARCYETLNRLELALRDVGTVLTMEPNNIMAIEIEERVKQTIGSRVNVPIDLVPLPEYLEPPPSSQTRATKDKASKKKSNVEEKVNFGKIEENVNEKKRDGQVEQTRNGYDEGSTMSNDPVDVKKTEDKLVLEEQTMSNRADEEPKRTVKLVFGEDIRWAQIPVNCTFSTLEEIVSDRFPSTKGVLVKYMDQEGDLITITTTEELRWAESSKEHGFIKLYITEVDPSRDLLKKQNTENGYMEKINEVVPIESTCISDWILHFANLFRNYVGFDVDSYIDLHESATKLYSEAIEETVTSEEAQDLFNSAADKFQEMAALALFNWGNVHMSRARKRIYYPEDSSRDSALAQVKNAYDWARNEYIKAGNKYEEALKIYSDSYEAVLALGQQQFEQAKLSWYYAISTCVDLQVWPSDDVLQLYNNAEENMEKGMQMWEEAEGERLSELSKGNKMETPLQKLKLEKIITNVSPDEASEQAANIRSQMYVLWGTILYERSIMEFKLGLPVWQECLEVAVEKFELAGASPTDLAVMIKNHCSNGTALEGLGFNIDEIVQAWNEMYEAKRLQRSVSSFRLEPLLRRRVSKLYYAFEHA